MTNMIQIPLWYFIYFVGVWSLCSTKDKVIIWQIWTPCCDPSSQTNLTSHASKLLILCVFASCVGGLHLVGHKTWHVGCIQSGKQRSGCMRKDLCCTGFFQTDVLFCRVPVWLHIFRHVHHYQQWNLHMWKRTFFVVAFPPPKIVLLLTPHECVIALYCTYSLQFRMFKIN